MKLVFPFVHHLICEITPTNAVEEALQVARKGLPNFGYERKIVT